MLLSFLLELLLILILSLVVIVALLLLIPFYYYINTEYCEGIVLKLSIKWAGLICLNGKYDNDSGFVSSLSIFSKEKVLKSNKNAEGLNKKKAKDKKRKKNNKIKAKINDILDKKFFEEVIAFLKKIVIVIKPKQLSITLLYGFDDPFITGFISGLTYFLESILPQGRYRIEPIFGREVIDFDMSAEGKITIGVILVELVKFIFKKDVRNKLNFFKKAETFS